ncbi:flagellar hook assembly protein FlgD [Pseudodesulfovibrio tunisiensis]|uniref:flagellar hook assembly protein FlgD n=1 Tax=Pseudodesulfovibrio tunisiensis TaxID=463192 RepID=UPI001FB4FD35|nr:flagellar hook assembly protein FlgD [Pseudodesulfovibrio tunisiensis]
MGYVDTGHILSGQEARLAASNTPDQKKSMDQEAFLTILVAQLTHQDPLNPMEDTEMTSQLAEFSSLEQLTSINSSVKSLGNSLDRSDMLSAVSFIGKSVRAEGYKVTKSGEDVSKIYYGFGEAVAKIKMNIYDKEGAIVRTIDIGSKQPGTYNFTWDGKNEKGQPLPDGIYSVGILGEDKDGKPVMVKSEVEGKVDGVVTENGVNYLRLEDGRFVNFLNVKEVVNAGSEHTGEDSGEDAGEDGSDTETS